MKKAAPTMKDVAKEAGVALGTVSKVFGGGAVGESYRIKVEQAAQKLGYQMIRSPKTPKAAKSKKNPTIAVILPHLENSVFCLLLQYLNQALAEHNCQMQLYLTYADPAREALYLQTAEQEKMDGAIGLVFDPSAALNLTIPFVAIDRQGGGDLPCVSSDNYGGGCMAAEKLISLGCKHLAFLRTGTVAYGEVDKRGDGFEAVCRTKKIPCDVCWLNDEPDFEVRFRRFFEEHTVDGKLEIDGIGCCTDFLAWKMRQLLENMGYRVPEDVQIIGYDGLRIFNTEQYFCSTIAQPLDKMAYTAVDVVLNLTPNHRPSLICLPVTYIPGGTTREDY